MRIRRWKAARGAVNVLMLGVLGFGAAQALASPAEAAARATCTRQQSDQCRAECWALYGRFAQSSCVDNGPFGVSCSCAPGTFPIGG